MAKQHSRSADTSQCKRHRASSPHTEMSTNPTSVISLPISASRPSADSSHATLYSAMAGSDLPIAILATTSSPLQRSAAHYSVVSRALILICLAVSIPENQRPSACHFYGPFLAIQLRFRYSTIPGTHSLIMRHVTLQNRTLNSLL